jgi:two-component system response regulator FixJ
MNDQVSVHVVDDDAIMLESLRQLLVADGFQTATYRSGSLFLDKATQGMRGCLITDLRMPEMSGIDLLEQVRRRNLALNVILLTGFADIPIAVRAMKLGAVDVVEKPVGAQELLEIVRKAAIEPPKLDEPAAQGQEMAERFSVLSAREREVLDLVVAGRQSKQIAAELGISPRTVEIHRANIMRKLGVANSAELVSFYYGMRRA